VGPGGNWWFLLASIGCYSIFEEAASGGRWDRPELHRMLGQLRKGDVIVVWCSTGCRAR
jgi:DNA invertase Pin-like site-specific DNA recombinase